MAQISYGTITITDTNDIESITIEYAQNQSTSSPPDATTGGWSTTRPAWAQGYYIWQRARIHKSGTESSSDTFGAAVCLTGSTGSTGATGRGISSIATSYCNYGTGTPAASYSGWQSTVPEYDSTKPNYWVKTVITYTTGSPATDTSIYKDNGITDAVATSAEANTTASDAWNKADDAQDDAAEALALAQNTNYAWWSLAEAKTVGQNTFAAGSYGTFINSTNFQNNPTNQPNIFMDAAGIHLRRALIDLASFTGTALTFNKPGASTKSMELTSSALNFYNSSGTLTSTFGDSISLASNGATITIGATTTGKYNTYIDSQGLYLRIGTTSYTTLTTNGIDFYGYYYPYAGGGTEQRTFGKIASLGENLQIGNTNDNHITIDSTGLSVFSKSDTVNSHVLLGTSNNRVTYNTYKKRFRTTWEYGTQFHYSCTIEGGTANHVFYVENNGKYENTGVMIAIDGTTYIISESGSSTGTTYDYSFSSATNNTSRTVNIIIELTYNAIIPGPRFQFGVDNNSVGTNSCTIGKGLTALAEDQIVLGRYNKLDFDAAFIIGNGTSSANRSNLFVVDGNGNLRVNNGFQIYNNDETDSIAEFGTTARIGKIDSSHFLMNASSLQAYNSSNQLYFEVSNTGIRFGNNLSSTVATQIDVADASYSVEIQVIAIDYVNNSATLVAIPYYQGSTTLPVGVTLSYQWYRNGSALTNTSTAPTVAGATTNTLQLGEGTDFGSNTTNAIYTCVIS